MEGFAGHHIGHHINEALCLIAARRAGLLAVQVDLVDIADVRAVISHRYDRTLATYAGYASTRRISARPWPCHRA